MRGSGDKRPSGYGQIVYIMSASYT